MDLSRWKLFKWVDGRQGSEYKVLTLAKVKIPSWLQFTGLCGFDSYLLKYPIKSFIPLHRDPVDEGYEHWRLNIVLRPDKNKDNTNKEDLNRRVKFNLFGRIILFRPDIHMHMVRQIRYRTRYVLSFGFLIKANPTISLLVPRNLEKTLSEKYTRKYPLYKTLTGKSQKEQDEIVIKYSKAKHEKSKEWIRECIAKECNIDAKSIKIEEFDYIFSSNKMSHNWATAHIDDGKMVIVTSKDKSILMKIKLLWPH